MAPCDEGRWLWWSFLRAWSFPCLSYSWTSCLMYCIHFSSFYYAILLSFLLWISALYLDLLLLLLFLLYKILVDNTYPKEYTNDSKQGLCCHRAKGHPLCYNRVGFNILISIESLSHILNNVPLLFTTTSNFQQG